MEKRWFILTIFIFLSIFGLVFSEKRKYSKEPSLPIGGIIPHHLLADFAIEHFFSRIKIYFPKTVVLIGPNHFEKGEMILSADMVWLVKNGTIEPETEIIKKLSRNKLIAINNQILSEEHSINAIMPYIKTYFPKAKVIPIIFRKNTNLTNLQNLVNELMKNIPKETIFISSVDFSHYLSSTQSSKKDLETLSAIKNFDYSKIMSFDNDHLDSPASIAAILLIMERKGRRNFDVLFHSNSGEILKNSLAPTTSYFTLLFH